MTTRRGEIAGPHAAARLAGALAELGVSHLTLRRDGRDRPLRARVTDLPGEIARGDCAIVAPPIIARFEHASGIIAWECDDPAAAAALASA